MFKRIYIEISNICDLECSFCPSVKREHKFLSLLDFEKILRQTSFITEEVCLHLMGEPFTHPNFDEIIKICEYCNSKVQVTTNGLNINKFQNIILNSPAVRQINFSVQCFKDNFPNQKIDDYLLDILNFAVKANELRPDLYINLRLWNIGDNSDGNEDVFLFVENFFKIKINRTVAVENIKSKRIWNQLYLHFDSRFEWPSLDLPYNGTKGTCHALKGHIGVLVDGTVVPCCLDKEGQMPLGNCLMTDINSILAEPRAIKIREGFSKGILIEELCQHCSYIGRFSRI